MIRNGSWTRWAVILLGVLALSTGCDQVDSVQTDAGPLDTSIYDNPDVSSNSPRLRLLLTDAPIDNVDNVWLTISQISAIPQNGGAAVVLSTESQTLDLLGLRYGVANTLGIPSLPPGDYKQIRLLVTDSTIVVDGITYDLFVPSGSTSGVKINFHYTASNDEIATMLIDWDASSSIHYAPGEGYIMQPVIQVRSFRTEPMDTNAPGAPSVVSPTHPSQTTWSDANSAQFNFSASDNIGMDGFSYTLDQIPSSVPDEVIDHENQEQQAQPCQPSEYPDEPTCAEIEPYVALENSIINIYGTNFGRWASLITVLIGEQEADILAVAPSQITVRVPEGLGKKPVTVITPKGEALCGRDLQIVGDNAFCPDGEYEQGKGLLGKVYEICQTNHNSTCRLPNFSTLGEPQSTIVACELDVPNHYFSEGFPGVDSTLVEWFAIRWTGSLIAPVSGSYKFRISSDDGSKVYIDGNLLIDNDGTHPVQSKSATITLEAGEHDFVLEYFQGPRWYIAQQLYWTIPGGTEEIIPKDYFLLPRNPRADVEAEPVCFCSGHGDGAYNYSAYGVSDGTGQLFTINLYADEPAATSLGIMRTSTNKVLSDCESLAVMDGRFFCVNNDGHNLVKNRLFEILPAEASGGYIPVTEIGQVKKNGSVVSAISCLALSPEGDLYAISTATNKLYQVDISTANLTEIMSVSGVIEGCAFGPSGTLYGTDNSGAKSKLVRINIDAAQIEDIGELPWSTPVKALGWHPDGFLYTGLDNQSNSFPAIAKVRPTDAVVVDYLDPNVKLSAVVGLDFDFASEQASCVCDMELASDTSISVTGAVQISDGNGDGFSERVTFSGDQMISELSPAGDSLSSYVGVDFTCFKSRSRISITQLELDKDDYSGNRFAFKGTTVANGFQIELLNPQTCAYQSVLTADVETDREYLNARGNKGDFWMRLSHPEVTNTINSGFLAAMAEQDEPAVMMVAFQSDDPSVQNNIRRGRTIGGSYALTLQPGKNVITGGETSDLPACPDPTVHEPNRSGSAFYSGLPDGVYYFHVRGVDDSGNWGPTSHYQIMVDNSAPAAPVITSQTHPSQELEYENPSPVFTVSASDLSGIAGYSYALNASPNADPGNNINGSSAEISFEDLEPGVYWFHVKAQNGSGLWSETSHYKVTIVEPQDENVPVPPPGYAGVPSITYMMGSPTSHPDRFTDEVQHWVSLNSYLIMQREVTNAEYRSCVAAYSVSETACSTDADCPGAMHYCNEDGLCATGCENEPASGASYYQNGRGDFPVTSVNWYDAYKYCKSQGLRLPTEAEWEYAAKGIDSDRYPWGNTYDGDRVNGQDNQGGEAMATGQYDGSHGNKRDGSVCHNGRCLYDMAGNVEEWVSDFYHSYPAASSEAMAVDNPNISTTEICLETCGGDTQCISGCEWKVTRGGSFIADPQRLRVFYRERRLPLMKTDYIGFRCAGAWDDTAEVPAEICDGVDNDGNGEIDEGFANTDSDGRADCIDDDDDNDGVKDSEDNCPLNANTDQFDPDMDGFGEPCDPDGEILPVNYAGLLRPWAVTIDRDGTIYVAGSTDGFEILSSGNNRKGAVMSISPFHTRTGQVTLADLAESNTQWRDFRPSGLLLAPNGFLYVADESTGYDDGVWKIARNPVSNQLGVAQSPVDRNGEPGSTQRFYMGDPDERGIDGTSGLAMDASGQWLYITRDANMDVRRFSMELSGDISDEDGYLGDEIASFNDSVTAPAVDSRGWLYYLRGGRLYRQKMVDGEAQTPELISDNKAFKKGVALTFDSSDNLYVLSLKGQSNVWPFRGDTADRMVPSESGYISTVSKAVLDAANPSNIITHADETKQRLVYGGPASREILYDSKRLNAPRGFAINPETGAFLVANTDSDELVILDPSTQTAEVIPLDGGFEAAE